ncbi:actinorhodin polyketide synthase [Nocardia sp. ET3-3]|uniref:Actinorhodin polyketide synthase n=1 Tax=Nocardia terrae TaxID=2675851 RepID=A0A7K1V3U9_9NOCA|nr:acyl carrier protein [Nocardia terrae]MVU81310.1 actinorhodin polyketide synthase [Nocardia terrae]
MSGSEVTQEISIESISRIGATKLGIPLPELLPEMKFDALGLDSLALLEFNIALQRAYGVELADEDIDGGNSITDVYHLLVKKNHHG